LTDGKDGPVDLQSRSWSSRAEQRWKVRTGVGIDPKALAAAQAEVNKVIAARKKALEEALQNGKVDT
jgi:hypothetical protein